MRIGIDITPIAQPRTGVGNYCYHVLSNLLREHPDCEFLGLTTGFGRLEPEVARGLSRIRRLPLPTRAMYALWDRWGRPRADRCLGNVDLYHATNFFMPPVAEAGRILTIYDLTFLVRPDLCSPKIVRRFAANVRRHAAEADAVLACSESTKADIVHYLGVEPGRVFVAYGAVEPASGPEADPREARRMLRSYYGIEGPFILYLGTLEPRKNLATLVRAFARASAGVDHKLVLAGGPGWGMEALHKAIDDSGVKDRIVLPGYVPEEHVPLLYAGADFFALVSHYEGFGLPLLEAMARGCPVIAADNSSLPEVVGTAGLLVNAAREEEISEAIVCLAGDTDLREDLRERGRRRATQFTWQEAATVTMAAYRSACAGEDR